LARSQRAALDRYLDIAIDTALAMNRLVGTVVVVAQFGDIVYQLAAGFAEREPRKPMRLNTIFRLASLTKPIVSAGVLALVDQARLSLDDPVTSGYQSFDQPGLSMLRICDASLLHRWYSNREVPSSLR
jgi:CubicO group peptidase (beta-lactamase class C family)